jgi:hypothetical protein
LQVRHRHEHLNYDSSNKHVDGDRHASLEYGYWYRWPCHRHEHVDRRWRASLEYGYRHSTPYH